MINKTEFIEFMLSADVLKFGEFVTKSGRQSPYFVNTGNYKTGRQISMLAAYYADLITQTTGGNFDAIFGPAYKGIPLASAISAKLWERHALDKPYFFNRKEEKNHGEGGNIVGYKPVLNDNIIIVEDVITAGTAIRETMPTLKATGGKVRDMFISVNRCEVGQDGKTIATEEVFSEFGITVHSIVTVKDIYEYVKSNNPKHSKLMENYMEKYVR